MYCDIISSIGTGGVLVGNFIVNVTAVMVAILVFKRSIAKDNEARLKEKADVVYVDDKFYTMEKEVDLKVNAIRCDNEKILSELHYIRTRLDMHIDGDDRKKVRYMKDK
jgi:hypothetical protein